MSGRNINLMCGLFETIGLELDNGMMKWCFGKTDLLVDCRTELKEKRTEAQEQVEDSEVDEIWVKTLGTFVWPKALLSKISRYLLKITFIILSFVIF
jgi:hypothetical protein